MKTIINTLMVIASIGGILFVYFRMLDAFGNSEIRKKSKLKYAVLWKKIDALNIHLLFLKIVNHYINLGLSIFKTVFKKTGGTKKISIILLGLFIILSSVFYFNFVRSPLKSQFPDQYFHLLGSIIIFIFICIILILRQLIRIDTTRLESFGINSDNKSLTNGEDKVQLNDTENSYLNMYASLFLIVCSLFIGFSVTLLNGNSIATLDSNTLSRLLAMNILFDGTTIFVSYQILKWIVQKSSLLITIIYIALDIITAGILAFASLYLGLLDTPEELNIIEVWNILLFRDRDGASLGIDRYFWIMHTTFLPIIVYCFIIILAMVAKYPTNWLIKFLDNVSASDKPHYATATTFALISVLASGLAALFKWGI